MWRNRYRQAILIGLSFVWGGLAIAIPETVTMQGVLKSGDGRALLGERVWQVRYFPAESGGEALDSQAGTLVVSETGRWSISLTPSTSVLDASGPVWYELGIDSSEVPDESLDPEDIFDGRVRLESVMFAQRARNSEQLGGLAADAFATDDELALALFDLVTQSSLDDLLAGKADIDHNHDARYSLLGHNHNGAYALIDHTHNLQELGGAVTDAQVPDDITVNRAAAAGSADLATTATIALSLTGFDPSDRVSATDLSDALANYPTTGTLAATLNDYATTTALATGLADKSDAAHIHDARYYTESEVDTALTGKSDTSHSHNLEDLDGAATDGQVPDDITVDFAAAAGTADSASTATVALSLEGFDPSDSVSTTEFAAALDDYATTSGLAAGLADKADAAHLHDDRYYTESEIDMTLVDYLTTVAFAAALDDYATTSDLVAGLAAKADAVHLHDDRYYTESEMDTALAGKSSTAHGHNLQDLGGAVTDAQVPNNITITEADTLHSVTGRGATTSNGVTAGSIATTTGDVTSGRDLILPATGVIYLGDPSTDGSWRIKHDGSGNLVFEARASGTWTEAVEIVKP